MRRVIIVLLGIVWGLSLRAQVSIEECVAKAEANYPLISRFRLLEATRDIDLAEVNNSWLPRIGVYGQVTGQNVVPAFPKTLAGVLDQMGQSMKGLGKCSDLSGLMALARALFIGSLPHLLLQIPARHLYAGLTQLGTMPNCAP